MSGPQPDPDRQCNAFAWASQVSVVSYEERLMSIDGPPRPAPGDPPPETSWGFSAHVVRLVLTRDQAEATIRFFGCIRQVIVASPRLQKWSTPVGPFVTPEDSHRWVRGEFSADEQVDVIVRALKTIALDPAGR